jgi:hypothetical protein
MDLQKKNLGEVYFKTEAKGESIETEVNYNIKNASENSLMYFFDVFDEVYKMKESDKKAAYFIDEKETLLPSFFYFLRG